MFKTRDPFGTICIVLLATIAAITLVLAITLPAPGQTTASPEMPKVTSVTYPWIQWKPILPWRRNIHSQLTNHGTILQDKILIDRIQKDKATLDKILKDKAATDKAATSADKAMRDMILTEIHDMKRRLSPAPSLDLAAKPDK